MDEDDYDYDYTYEDQSDPAGELEVLYETARRQRTAGALDDAVAGFESVIRNEMIRSELGFRALEQLYQVATEKGQFPQALLLYHQLLDYATFSSSVPHGVVEETIRGIVDNAPAHSRAHAEEVLAKTAAAFENIKDQEQLWVLSKRSLVELWLDRADADLNRIDSAIEDLHLRLKDANKAENPDKIAQLWDIYALHMRLIRRRTYRGRLEVLCDRIAQLCDKDSSPLRAAFAKEYSAYVHFHKGNYPQAYLDFFEAFSTYSVSSEKGRCLAYTNLVSVLAKRSPVRSTAAALQVLESDRLAHEALKLVDAYHTGGFRQMEGCFEASDETLREDEFANHVLGVIRLPLVTVRMPSEIWKDVFQPLSRCYLEHTALVCLSWRGLTDSPTAPARHFDHVAFLAPRVELIHAYLARPRERRRGPFFVRDEPYEDSPLTFEWTTDAVGAVPNIAMPFAMNQLFGNYNRALDAVEQVPVVARTESRVMLGPRGVTRHDEHVWSREGPLVELMDFLAAMTRHAYVEHFYLAGPLTEQLVDLLSPQFVNEVTIKTLVYGVPEGQATPEDAETLHRLFLSFRRTPNLVVATHVNAAFMIDAFLAECRARGVTEIRLPREKPRGEDGEVPLYPVTTDAVFDFCCSAGDRGGKRTFNAWRCQISGDFIERIVNDSENPLTTDPVELRFFVPRGSPTDRALQTTLHAYGSELVRCVRNVHRMDRDKEVYRWTTTTQTLRIKTSQRHGADNKRFYRIQRGGCESPEFRLCDCTATTQAFFNS